MGAGMAYVPILKGKAGEFRALEHATSDVRERLRPVMEIVPDPDVRDVLETFCRHAMDAVPLGEMLTVDCGALPTQQVLQEDAGGPVARISESLALRGIELCPVVRLTDGQESVREAREAVAGHGRGVCLRIPVTPSAAMPSPSPDLHGVRRLLKALSVDVDETDLLLDAGPVHAGARAKTLEGCLLAALDRLARWPWRHVCVAAGGFPPNLKGFPRGKATAVARHDARLWQQVTERWNGEPPDFGDFGVTHPHMPAKSRRPPDPNMRYTTKTDWQVFVYPRIRAGNDDFFVLSEDLVASPYWPTAGSGTSWGDQQVLECARRRRPKAGGGTEWRAWATSHHLAVVATELG